MRFVDRYPIVVTEQLVACRDFWVRRLGFTAAFESSWIVYLTTDDESASIAFMTPDHPSAPPGPEPFSGAGLCFELQVEDAAKVHRELTANGLRVDYPLTDEPLGLRRFGFRDRPGSGST